jgi:hypothetical protein
MEPKGRVQFKFPPSSRDLKKRVAILPLSGQFLTEVRIEIANMRILTNAYRDGSFAANAQPIGSSGYFQQSLLDLPNPEELEVRAIDSAALAIIRSFTDLLDRLVAIKEISNLSPPPAILSCTSQEEMDETLAALIQDRINQVAKKNRPLKSKAADIVSADDEMFALLENVSWLRRSIEHRKKVASNEITVVLHPFELPDGGRINTEGTHQEIADRIAASVQVNSRTLAFQALEEIALSRQDVEDLGFTLAFMAATPLVQALSGDTGANPYYLAITVEPVKVGELWQ